MPESEEGSSGSGERGKGKPKPQPRQSYSNIPMSYYWLKDSLKQFFSHEHFPDALAVSFALISASIAFPYFPLPVLVLLVLALFIVTLFYTLIGLMVLLFSTFLMFIYQAPLLAWLLGLFIGISLFFGYKHYRTITFIYSIMMLSLSGIGYILVLPAFVIGSLYVGFRRSVISVAVILFMLPMLSGLTQTQLSAPLVYNYQTFSAAQSGSQQYFVSSKPATDIFGFLPATGSALLTFLSFKISGDLLNAFGFAIGAIYHDIGITLVQLFVWLLVVFAMTNYVIKSRSAFKGTEASMLSFLIVAVYMGLSFIEGQPFNTYVMLSFLITPVSIYLLESNNVAVVKALEVMKQDFLGKFGEAFEELTSGTKETLDDVANYDETKTELRQAVLGPIEKREISGAYNVKPAKGILLFGPPGTGKTLIMRALANEVRAKFFYVKTSALVSPYQGEGVQTLSKIFDTVRKSPPAILFFDEIDGIAGSRELQENETNRQLLSTLLSEMDGFQKVDGVVIVGTTNSPQLLDQSIMRPGRFDKVIYMSLPNKEGRSKIFQYYLNKLPVNKGASSESLAELTNRYSGADIKNVCNEVARQIADEAVKESKVLEITQDDIESVIKHTKPSTSLVMLDRFNTFKMDYERRARTEGEGDKEDRITFDDVVDLQEAKKTLYEAIEIPIMHPELVKKYDVKSIKGILLFGPPGVGKTMLMRAIKNEMSDVSIITLLGSDISRAGIERVSQTINDVFNRAKENAPSIIFIDEIDALAPSRAESSELGVQATSEILQNLDGIKTLGNVIVVAATNRPDHLDPALIRAARFDRLIFVPPPNKDDRKKLFRMSLENVPLSNDIDLDKIVDMTTGFSCADIVEVCRKAKLTALEANIYTSKEKKISMQDLTNVISGMKPSAPAEAMGVYMDFLSQHQGR
ncbi:MAG: AAA family ATPase [Candidatus Micrarchaeota archaeon]|nr:AAA family ATPase [Candidatus Micrarchaeota archaeon]